jgi:hypothetical protein
MRAEDMRTAVIALLVVLVAAGGAAGKYSGGTGDANDPYRIATPNDLNDIGNYPNDWDKHFVMTDDINLVDYNGTSFRLIGYWENWYDGDNVPFVGVFDGNGHTISNFTYSLPAHNGVGLFTYLGRNGQIKDLDLTNVDVNAPGRYCIGGLVAFSEGTVSGCRAEGNMRAGRYVAVLVGYAGRPSLISECLVSGRVSGTNYPVGGLVSGNEDVVSDCGSYVAADGVDSVGSLVGENYWEIRDCFATGDVQGSSQIGGLVGYNTGTIERSWSSGDVSGYFASGGLVGENNDEIINCYAVGDVNGSYDLTGGLVGRNYYHVYYCYAAGRVTGAGNLGGFAGVAYSLSEFQSCFWDQDVNPTLDGIAGGSDPNVIGISTAQMQTESTFTDAGWDFVEVWGIGEGQTYPFLRVYPAGDMNHDGIVDWRDFAILAGHWLESME